MGSTASRNEWDLEAKCDVPRQLKKIEISKSEHSNGDFSRIGSVAVVTYFFMFNPENWSFMIQFDDHTVSNGLVQPPGRLWFLNQGPI